MISTPFNFLTPNSIYKVVTGWQKKDARVHILNMCLFFATQKFQNEPFLMLCCVAPRSNKFKLLALASTTSSRSSNKHNVMRAMLLSNELKY
jgi:hypothetical protein